MAGSGAGSEESAHWRRDLAACGWVASVVFLFFFRARWAFTPRLSSDEGCYLSMLWSWLGLELSGACPLPENYFAPGTSLLWIPVGLFGRLLAAFSGDPPEAWIVPVISLFSFACWGGALFFIVRILRENQVGRALSGNDPVRWGLAVLLCSPTLYYATHRTEMAHAGEILVAAIVIWLLQRGKTLWAALAGLLLTLVRYNDFPVMFLVLGSLWSGRGGIPPRQARFAFVASATAFGIALVWIGFVNGYGGSRVPDLLGWLSIIGLREFIFGGQAGMSWSGLWWLSALAIGTLRLASMSWVAKGAWAWMVAEAVVAIAWETSGGDFGYRYLTGSNLGALVVWMDLARGVDDSHQVRFRDSFRWLAGLNAALLTYCLIAYKTVSGTGPNPELGTNPDFFWKAISAPFASPEVFKIAAFQQLPLMTLLLSYSGSESALDQKYSIAGPELLLLTLATAVALGYAILYPLRRRKRIAI